MAVALTYPGVYIEETPSSVHTITGVSTSVTAFVGFTVKGPVNKAVHIFNFGDYERNFGGLSKDSALSYAVQQYFLNGGAEAWVVRVADGAVKAGVKLCRPDGKKMLDVTASSAGTWGNYLKIDVDYVTTNPDSTFNLAVTEYIPNGTELTQGRKEVFQNLSMDSNSSQYAPNVIGGSQLITVARDTDVNDTLLGELDAGWSLSGDVSSGIFPLANTTRFISIVVDGDGPHEVPIFADHASPPADLDSLVIALENAIKGINPGKPCFNNFTVERAARDGSANATGMNLKFTSGTPPSDKTREHSSVRLLNASSNDLSGLLRLGLANRGREGGGAAGLRPAVNGTLGADISTLDLATLGLNDDVQVTVADGGTSLNTGTFQLGDAVASLSELAAKLQEKIRAISSSEKAFSQAVVQVSGTRLRILSGTDNTDAQITFTDSGGSLASDVGIDSGTAYANVQRYSPGVGQTVAAQVKGLTGETGSKPNATELIGDLGDKTGIHALEDVEIFNLLCIPLVADLDDTSAFSVISKAQAYCASRRAFYIVDPPRARNTLSQIQDWDTNTLTPDKNSALYFPFVTMPDPLDGYRLHAFAPSGTLAGLYARTDSNRGVWKAPAGTEATLVNVQGLAYKLTDAECGVLNQLGVNCLRQLPVYGRVSWGARTLEGNDQEASQWKYISVRRTALYIEESLYRGTQWVVFEPNDEPLWAQIRLNVGAFMQTLFRKGAFQGSSPREAYLVKCDKETTTQDDIDRGVVNILVGFAPLKPAEFVVIQIQQIAGQSQA